MDTNITIEYAIKLMPTLDGDEPSIEALQAGLTVINDLKLWSWFKTYEPQIDKGFMFDNDNTSIMIGNEISKHYDLTGFSYAWIMRQLQYISKHTLHTDKK